jgi:hypothetical protein
MDMIKCLELELVVDESIAFGDWTKTRDARFEDHDIPHYIFLVNPLIDN